MRLTILCLLFLFLTVSGFGQAAQTEVPALVRDFLAHVADPAMHERFWADDLMYTSAAGVFRTKAQILASMKLPIAPGTIAPETFTAEDMTVHDFGTTAIVAFRLVRHSAETEETFRNTGTFLFRNGKWQAAGWQATRIAAPENIPETQK
ncbi:MAG: hypothetical protein NVS9B15_03230 [Acidobacteriaceae bacterium]